MGALDPAGRHTATRSEERSTHSRSVDGGSNPPSATRPSTLSNDGRTYCAQNGRSGVSKRGTQKRVEMLGQLPLRAREARRPIGSPLIETLVDAARRVANAHSPGRPLLLVVGGIVGKASGGSPQVLHRQMPDFRRSGGLLDSAKDHFAREVAAILRGEQQVQVGLIWGPERRRASISPGDIRREIFCEERRNRNLARPHTPSGYNRATRRPVR